MAQCPAPTLCVDCEAPISRASARCMACAGRHRQAARADVRFEPSPIRPADEPGTRRVLTVDEVRWVEEHAVGFDLPRVARLLGVDPGTVARLRAGSHAREHDP